MPRWQLPTVMCSSAPTRTFGASAQPGNRNLATEPNSTSKGKALALVRGSSRFALKHLLEIWICLVTGIQGLLVMPLRQFLERRLLRGVNDRQEIVRVTPARLQLNRFAQ